MRSHKLAEVEATAAAEEDVAVVTEETSEVGEEVVVMGSEAEAMVISVVDGAAEVIVALSTSRTKTLSQAWAAHSYASDPFLHRF